MIKKYRYHIIGAVAVVAVLALSFFFGGDMPQENKNLKTVNKDAASVFYTQLPQFTESVTESPAPVMTEAPILTETPAVTEAPPTEIPVPVQMPTVTQAPIVTEAPVVSETPVATPKQIPFVFQTETPYAVKEPEIISTPVVTEPPVSETPAPEENMVCTISVRCDTILNNMNLLDKEKAELVPADGVILPETEAVFYENESVFNVLVREMKRNKIHLEFVNVPVYNSAYIEGIGNLYEFECGELSGWVYKVNDTFPAFGSSTYELKPGDKIQWLYTCDLGKDVGDESGTRNGFIK